MKKIAALLVLTTLAAIGCSVADEVKVLPTAPMQAVGQERQSYIVTLQPNANPNAIASSVGASPRYVYVNAIKGFAAQLPDAAVAALRRNPNVVRVEPDGVASLDAVSSWGLDRIDARAGLDGSYTPLGSGAGVRVYIIDSGINYGHADFGGRSVFGTDFIGSDGSDCRGHGTHVSGTVGGAQYGVAKSATLVSVRVFDCTGSTPTSVVIAAVDWVTGNAVRPAVVNMSLGAPTDGAMNAAVAGAIASGLVVVVSAGNGNTDACSQSPASEPQAITVGATDQIDTRSSFSNFGACVDLFAPGSGITSAWYTGSTATQVLSGTSMSSPHVAGAAALILGVEPSLSPAAVRDLLWRRSTKAVVINSQSANGHLLYTNADEQAVPPGQDPVAAFSVSCVATTCQFVDQSSDVDGPIASRQWQLPGFTTTEAAFTYRFPYGSPSGSPWSVWLTVTDSDGRVATLQRNIYVTQQITLTARVSKRQGQTVVEYSWVGEDAGMDSMVLHFQHSDYSYMTSSVVANTGSGSLVLPFKGKLAPSQARVCQNRPVGPEYQCSQAVFLP